MGMFTLEVNISLAQFRQLFFRMFQKSWGNSTWENVILLPLTCEDKRPNGRGEHEMLDK